MELIEIGQRRTRLHSRVKMMALRFIMMWKTLIINDIVKEVQMRARCNGSLTREEGGLRLVLPKHLCCLSVLDTSRCQRFVSKYLICT